MLKIRVEPPLKAKLDGFRFQVDAVEAVKELPYAAVFHEQGLGKTKIGIDISLTWLNAGTVDSVLIVTKKSLVENWRQEIHTHTYLTPRVIGADRHANHLSFNSPARFYLLHYEACISEKTRLLLFQKTRKLGIILDEAQKIKNPESKLAKTMFALAPGFVRRVIMTGTPIANRPYDIWSLIWFLDQGASLGTTFPEFKSQLDLSNKLASDNDKEKAFRECLAGLFGKIERFAVRETKDSVEITLPTKQIHSIKTDFEPRQQELYLKFRDELRAEIVKNGNIVVDDADDILKRLLRLVQIASNPGVLDESYTETPGKFDTLLRLLKNAEAEPTKSIVWTTFTDNVDWLASELKVFSPARVHGKMSISDRNAAIARFKKDDKCRVFIATPGAAKEGLTLTMASYAIFYDRSFSLDDYLQAQDRIHRISQARECHVYNLIMRDSVDEWVDALLGAKHLAAKLGQGDIDAAQYGIGVSYEFATMLQGILGNHEQ